MVNMTTLSHESDSEEDTLTSSECSESSDDESSEHDKDDTSDTASYRSLAISVRRNRSTATVKSKKTKKRVRFKPGDSLVLIYVIPNREMLGLKSDSEESDYGESDEDSDDESDVDDDDDDDDDEDDDDDDDDDNGNSKKNKSKSKKPKPFAKLLAVKQVNRRKPLPDLRNNFKKAQEKTKLVNVDFDTTQATSRKKQRSKVNRKDKKEKIKVTKKDSSEIKTKQLRNTKKGKSNAIKTDIDKPARGKRNRSRLLEIRATVESSKSIETNAPVPKVIYKHDTKPSVIDINNSAHVHNSKLLTNRTKLQPTSFRISKPGHHSGLANSTNSPLESTPSVARVVSASYDSLSSVLPSSYVSFNAFQNSTVEETIKRLDPDNMNASGKRNYAWQIANGTISSQSLRTPSILPFWDSLQNSVTDNNTLKLPT